MKVLVCGGRDYLDDFTVQYVLSLHHRKTPITTLIHGGARGADYLAAKWAAEAGIAAWPFYTDWNKHGKAAGPIRNQRMLDEGKPDLVIAFPGGKGTAHMVRIARAAGISVAEARGP